MIYSKAVTGGFEWDEALGVYSSGEKITIYSAFSPNIALSTSSMFYNDFNFRCDGNRFGQLSNGDYTIGSTNRFNYIGDDIISANNPLSAIPRITGFHNFYNNINTVFGTINPDQINSIAVDPVVYWHHHNAAGANTRLKFLYKEGTGGIQELATLHANGNFGINTINPLSKLEVKGGLNITDQTATIVAPNGFIYASGGIHMGSESFINSVAGNTFIATYPGTKTALGLNNPAAYLHLHALTTSNTNHFKITTNVTGDAATDGISIDMNGTNVDIANHENGSIRFSTGSTNALVLDNAQNAIINGSTPFEKLTVYGDAVKSFGGTAWATWSDIRLKENIKPFSKGLNDVIKINPVEFNYNGKINTNRENKEIGVIAQDLLEIAPFMVKNYYDSSFGDFLAVNNGAMVYMLINSVKELNQELIELKNNYNELKNLIEPNSNGNKNQNLNFFEIFPNPTDDKIFFKVNLESKNDIINVEFFNEKGEINIIDNVITKLTYEVALASIFKTKSDFINCRLIINNKIIDTRKLIIIR